MAFIGIDPGKSGGIAVLRESSPAIELLSLQHATDAEVAQFLWPLMMDNMDPAVEARPSRVLLEDPRGVLPGVRTPKSIAGPAESFGFLRGVCTGRFCIEIVRPQAWQKGFKLPTRKAAGSDTAKKRAHRQRASELFPQVKVTNWNADALLIAEYGRRQAT